jgi:hypothetical protein
MSCAHGDCTMPVVGWLAVSRTDPSTMALLITSRRGDDFTNLKRKL